MFVVGNPFLFAKVLDMNECDAPVLNKTNAVKELRGNIPITASGSFITSSTLRWFTWPFWNGLGLASSVVLFSGQLEE
jgi:hypothetical protein